MPERSKIGVTRANVIILATDEVTVIAPIPATMSGPAAAEVAQRIFDQGMVNKGEHYDRYCRGDYDIETFFEEELEKCGFTIINTRGFS